MSTPSADGPVQKKPRADPEQQQEHKEEAGSLDWPNLVFESQLCSNTFLGHFGEDTQKKIIVQIDRKEWKKQQIFDCFKSCSKINRFHHNDAYSTFTATMSPDYSGAIVKTVYPASDKQIKKKTEQKFVQIRETAEEHRRVTRPYIQSIPSSHVEWVYNILDHKKEQDRIVLETEGKESGFIMVPSDHWADKTVLEKLYLIGLPKRRDISCLRDLRREHVPLLKSMQTLGKKAIQDKYGVPSTSIRTFVHYLPTFNHFHIHFVRDFIHPGSVVGLAHLLDDVIENLELEDPEFPYYNSRSLTFFLGEVKHKNLLDSFQKHREEAQSHMNDDGD